MTARPIRRNAQTPDRNGKIFYTSTTSLSHISKETRIVTFLFNYSDIVNWFKIDNFVFLDIIRKKFNHAGKIS